MLTFSHWNDLPGWWPLAICLYGLALLLPVWSDVFRGKIVPNVFMYPLTAVAAVMLVAGPGKLVHLLAFICAWLAFYIVCTAGKMGWGDLKLILPVAALSGANVLTVIWLAFFLSMPWQLYSQWSRKRDKLDSMPGERVAPFGPGAVLAAQGVWLAMGLPTWVGIVWAIGWTAMFALGLAERRWRAPLLPAHVRDLARGGAEGPLADLAGRHPGWIESKSLRTYLLDDEHWDELRTSGHTVQPLGNERAVAMTRDDEAGRWTFELVKSVSEDGMSGQNTLASAPSGRVPA